MTWSALSLRSSSGFNCANKRAVLPPLPPPVKEVTVSMAGILQDDVSELAHFLGHGREGKVLIALDQAADAAGVLLREKSLGSNRE